MIISTCADMPQSSSLLKRKMIVRVFTAFGGTHGEGVSFSKHPDYPLDRHILTGGNDNEVEISRDYHSESDAHTSSKQRDFFKDTKHRPPSLQKITGRQFRECQVGLNTSKFVRASFYKPLRV